MAVSQTVSASYLSRKKINRKENFPDIARAQSRSRMDRGWFVVSRSGGVCSLGCCWLESEEPGMT
jgi:hypothetical protein